jgi:hypothetical protein
LAQPSCLLPSAPHANPRKAPRPPSPTSRRATIPVLLTVQIDSVKHLGVDGPIIPPNVAKAADFHQTGGLLRGRKEIRAADASRTRILAELPSRLRQQPRQVPRLSVLVSLVYEVPHAD